MTHHLFTILVVVICFVVMIVNIALCFVTKVCVDCVTRNCGVVRHVACSLIAVAVVVGALGQFFQLRCMGMFR